MASSRDRSSLWSRLRPPQSADSLELNPLPVLAMDIWSFLDDFGGPYRARGSSRTRGQYVHEAQDLERVFTDWLWLINTSRVPRGRPPPELIDTAAVLRECRKVVHKPAFTLWGKPKVESECPVCLEKLVAKDKLYVLPCKHQFHVHCLTPWIKRNHACCPCCRADILAGPKKEEERVNSTNVHTNIVNFSPWRNTRGGDGATSSRGNERSLNGRRSSMEDPNAWEGLHEYILAALAEVDAELNRFIR